MNQINCFALKPLYLYSVFFRDDIIEYVEYIAEGEFLVFEVNGILDYDFVTSLN